MASNGKRLPDLRSQLNEMAPPPLGLFRTDFALRLLVLSASVASLAIVLTSRQTKVVGSPLLPIPLVFEAKFTYSSAIIYFVVATSVVCLHSLLSAVISFFFLPKASPSSNRPLLLLAFLDTLMAAVMASATGAVAAVFYIGWKGNSHVGWSKVCDVFDKFCAHAVASGALALGVSSALVVLVMISTYSLYCRAASAAKLQCFVDQVETHAASEF